jgi:hypothetical protein
MRMLAVLFCLCFRLPLSAQVRPGQLNTTIMVQTTGTSGHLLTRPLPIVLVISRCRQDLGPCPSPETDKFSYVPLGDNWDMSAASAWSKEYGKWAFKWSITFSDSPKLQHQRRHRQSAEEAK